MYGRGFAQPDFYFVLPGAVLVIEAKLSQCETRQISHLYKPLLSHLYNRPVVGCLVFKNRIQRGGNTITNIKDLLGVTEEKIFDWHFLGY